jgi:hypothetical protein
MPLKVVKENPQFVEDTDIGIILPARMRQSQWVPHAYDNLNKMRGGGMSYGVKHVEGVGTVLEHDNETGIAFWPAYASGLDDFLMRSLVQGYMANSGATPVVDTLLATIVAKIQGMVGTWVNSVRGRKTPVKKTLDLMSRANNSQFGAAEFVRDFMGALCVDNRGAIGAQVPIEHIDVDKWAEYGMELEEIAGQRPPGASNVKPDLFVLRMTTEAFRENQGVYMIDGLTCFPTGDTEYPYWIRKLSRERKRDIWVLIHRDFGFQILQQSGPRNKIYKGYGQSGAWRFSPYEIKHMAIERQDWEHLINQPMRGIVWVSGLDTPDQFRNQLTKYREDLDAAEMKFYPGVFFGGSKGENSKINMLPWSEPPSGYTPKEWDDTKVSKLAASFHLNETHLQLKLGEGAMTQSGVADSLEAETAVAWMRHTLEMCWNYIAPPRVTVTVIWQSDRQRRIQIESARELSLALSRLLKVDNKVDWDNNVFTKEEVRALFTNFIGIEIPKTEEGVIGSTDKHGPEDVEDVEESMAFTPATDWIDLLDYPRIAVFAVGNKVRLISGQEGYIARWSGNNDWVWIRTGPGVEMLVAADRFDVIEFTKLANSLVDTREWTKEGIAEMEARGRIMTFDVPPVDPLIPAFDYAAGQRVYVGENDTPATIVKANDDIAFVAFDWAPDPLHPHAYPLEDVRPMGWQPEEGEPLDFPTSVETDQDEATDDAQDLWDDISPEGKEDLI